MATSRAIVVYKRITKVETIEIDSCLEETHDLTNTVTDHPVEDGFDVSDHSRPDPDQVKLRCFISNTPLSVEQQLRSIRAGDTTFDTTATGPVTIGAVGGRGDKNFVALKKLRDEGTFIQVVTTLKTYGLSATQGMAITAISVPRTRQNYDGLEFTISLKQIRIVKNRSTQDSKRKQKKKSTRPQDDGGGVMLGPEEQPTTQLHKEIHGSSGSVTGFVGKLIKAN